MRLARYIGPLVFLACSGSTEPPLAASTSGQITVTLASPQPFLMDSSVAFSLTNGGSSAIQVAAWCHDTTQVMGSQLWWNGTAWVGIVTVCVTNHLPITLQPGETGHGAVALQSCPGHARLEVFYNVAPNGSGVAYSPEFEIQVINPSPAVQKNCGL